MLWRFLKFTLLLLLCFNISYCQKFNIEQYYYTANAQQAAYGGIAGYNSRNNWHTELRYNYEDNKTISVYTGKTFSRNKKLSYEATPMLGIVVGNYHGGSAGLNFDVNYSNWYFSTQSQYTFSMKNKNESYFFNWSEAGSDITGWMYAGIAIQHTRLYATKGELVPGAVAAINIKNFTLPFYIFNPFNERKFFVIDLIWEWSKLKK